MALEGVASKEEFRNQVKVLALTVFFAIVGVTFTKDGQAHRNQLIGIACIANIGFYSMDTYLLDLMYRETALAGKMGEYILQWDMLNADQINHGYQTAMRGLDESTTLRKFLLGIGFAVQESAPYPWRPRKIDWLWYGGPAGAVLVWIRFGDQYLRWASEKGWSKLAKNVWRAFRTLVNRLMRSA